MITGVNYFPLQFEETKWTTLACGLWNTEK